MGVKFWNATIQTKAIGQFFPVALFFFALQNDLTLSPRFLGSLYNQSVIMQFISQWKTGSLTKRSPSSFNPWDLRALAIGQQDQPIRKSNASFLSNWWSGYSYSLQSVATPFKDWPTRLASSNIRFMVKEGKHQGELNENFAKPKRGSQVGRTKSIVRS